MNIAVDIQALQSHASLNRGIGRYVSALLELLLERAAEDGLRYDLYANKTLPEPALPPAHRGSVRTVDYGAPGGGAVNEVLLKTTLLDAGVDALFLPSPMTATDSVMPDYADFPAKVYAICYDLIPLVLADAYLSDPPVRAIYTRQLANVRAADFVFAISEATRQDAIRHLDRDPERTINISAGVSPFFRPVPSEERAAWRRRLSVKFGIAGPFLLYTGGEDWRKNLEGLIQGFAALPPGLRASHQLVIACKLSEAEAARLEGLARQCGLGPRALVLTNFVTDEELRALYTLCSLFVFPSFYEGFGLPLVEAMACGAPVIASNNSSLPELVGSPEQLFDARSPETIARKICAVLSDEALRRNLARTGPEQAARFSWRAVAERVSAVLRAEKETPRREATIFLHRGGHGVPAGGKPRVAYFSPFPPVKSGIADYTQDLLPALAAQLALDLYHDPGYVPQIGAELPAFSQAQFENNVYRRGRAYDALVYQMGNSSVHGHLLAHLLRYAGVTVLHDYNLTRILHHLGNSQPEMGITLEAELEHSYGPARAREITRQLAVGEATIERLPAMGVYANRRIFTRSLGVIVHSRWAYDLAVREWARDAEHIAHIPQLMALTVDGAADPEKRCALRRKHGVPEGAFVIASCGFVHTTKRPIALLDAFRHHLAAYPDAFLLFVGETDVANLDLEAEIRKRGLESKTRITGYLPMEDFRECIALADVGVNLRFPFGGETSAALLRILAHGKPTIVTDIGSFSDFPDAVVHKIPPPDRCADEAGEIVKALRALAENDAYREDLGRSAAAHIAGEHSPERCARLYREFIEQVMAAPSTRRKLLADYAGRELGRVGGSSEEPERLFAPFRAVFASEDRC